MVGMIRVNMIRVNIIRYHMISRDASKNAKDLSIIQGNSAWGKTDGLFSMNIYGNFQFEF